MQNGYRLGELKFFLGIIYLSVYIRIIQTYLWFFPFLSL